ncbi:MAG TPA: hypothetical protein VLA37_07135 [Sphingomonadaceae bacterium]|nr:hypothetical protein [Sphingomonadaceae bacterium]
MSEEDRENLKQRIAAGEARQEARELALADRAAEARDRLTRAAREHPFLLIAGGLAIGVAISALVPRSPTRRLTRNAIGFLAMLTELGVTYSREALEDADEARRAGKEKLAELGNSLIDSASRLKDRVLEKAG